MGDAATPDIRRERPPFKITPEILAWADENSGVAGLFGSYSHAVERAIDRLRLEHETLRLRCLKERKPFRPQALSGIYRDDLEATKPSRGGRPFKNKESTNTTQRAPATVAVELLDWARANLVRTGLFEGMSQVVEVGLRRLRAEGPTTVGSPSHPFDPELLWRAYTRQLAQPATAD